MRDRLPTIRILRLSLLCVVLTTLGVVCAAHTLVGAPTACASSTYSQSCGTGDDEHPEYPDHGPSDTHCVASTRDVTSTVDTGSLAPDAAADGIPPAFHRTSSAVVRPSPAFSTPGREILSLTCVWRT
ncbi:hypothetical protein [Saccharopolyspora sp. NPDC002686]|uniref:hypothetical protein n=1 Tax=Saccharopolyspora sp. NPDC002686 TaxID=3154541 RepID=UPI00331C7991